MAVLPLAIQILLMKWVLLCFFLNSCQRTQKWELICYRFYVKMHYYLLDIKIWRHKTLLIRCWLSHVIYDSLIKSYVMKWFANSDHSNDNEFLKFFKQICCWWGADEGTCWFSSLSTNATAAPNNFSRETHAHFQTSFKPSANKHWQLTDFPWQCLPF